MAIAKKAFIPGEPRMHVLPVEIKGLVEASRTYEIQRPIPFLVWDVSAHGLGILISDRLEKGEVLDISFTQPINLQLACSVVWCDQQEVDYDFQEPSYRVGLIAVEHAKVLQPLMDIIEKISAIKPK